jgi:hypothetical protein
VAWVTRGSRFQAGAPEDAAIVAGVEGGRVVQVKDVRGVHGVVDGAAAVPLPRRHPLARVLALRGHARTARAVIDSFEAGWR